MFVSVNALYNVLSFEVERHQFIKDSNVHRYLRKTNEDSTHNSVELLRAIPGMSSNVLYSVTNVRICL